MPEDYLGQGELIIFYLRLLRQAYRFRRLAEKHLQVIMQYTTRSAQRTEECTGVVVFSLVPLKKSGLVTIVSVVCAVHTVHAGTIL